MADDITDAITHVLSSGLDRASENEILRQLDAELEQQNQARALVLGTDEPAPWVLGGDAGGGFGSIARRFISFYAAAIRSEICDAEGGCLKSKYRSPMGEQIGDTVRTIAPLVLDALGRQEHGLTTPATVAAMVALWLVRSGLEQWCAQAPPSSTPAAPTPAA